MSKSVFPQRFQQKERFLKTNLGRIFNNTNYESLSGQVVKVLDMLVTLHYRKGLESVTTYCHTLQNQAEATILLTGQIN